MKVDFNHVLRIAELSDEFSEDEAEERTGEIVRWALRRTVSELKEIEETQSELRSQLNGYDQYSATGSRNQVRNDEKSEEAELSAEEKDEVKREQQRLAENMFGTR